MIRYILVRHAQTKYNKENRLQGSSNSSLTSEGIQTAEALGEHLKAIPIDKIYSSDSLRTVQTAQAILKGAGQDAPIHQESFLREYYFGGLEGMPYRKAFGMMMRRYGALGPGKIYRSPKQMVGLTNGFAAIDKTHQAENFDDVAQRLKEGMARLSKNPENTGKNILLVAHGLVLSILIYLIDPDEVPRGLLKNTSFNLVTYDAGVYQVLASNVTDYQKIKQYFEPHE